MADMNELLEAVASRAVDLAKQASEASVVLDALRALRAKTVVELGAAAMFAAIDRELEAAAERRMRARDAIDTAFETVRAQLADAVR
jgi:hypothetical protein